MLHPNHSNDTLLHRYNSLESMDLDINDILRQLSPSPNSIPPPSPPPLDPTPEPPDINDVVFIRQRLIAMGIVDPPTTGNSLESISSNPSISPRERELAEMVLRLTHPGIYSSSSQLVDQATTIAQLSQLRDFLIKRQQDEHQSWEAERENWVRVLGALSARRFEDGQHRADVLERDNLNLISENVMLKRKLQDQQMRMESLDTELRALRPLLLLRPVSPPLSSRSLPPTMQAQPPRPAGRPRKPRDKERDRFSDDELDLHHAKQVHNTSKYNTTGDARTEHLLLAARRLGKQKIAALLPSSSFPMPPPGQVGVSVTALNLSPNFVGTYGQPHRPLAQTPSHSSPHRPIIPQSPSVTPKAGYTSTAMPHHPYLPTSPLKTPSTPSHHLFPTTASPTAYRTSTLFRTSSPPPHPVSSQGTTRRPQTPQTGQPPRTPRRTTADLPKTAPSALEHLIHASQILDNNIDRTVRPATRKPQEGSPQKKRKADDDSQSLSRMPSGLDVLAEQAAVVISQSPRKQQASTALRLGEPHSWDNPLLPESQLSADSALHSPASVDEPFSNV